jgi:hypothetical protein
MNFHTTSLTRVLLLSLTESRIGRIKYEADLLESEISLIADLRKQSECSHPCADLRLAARACRTIALRLDEMAAKAEAAS